MSISVAIVGSGPSGFYAAEALIKSDADVTIDIIDRLPTPFGLIRGGVAPDHQTTKRVSRAYERTLGNDRVRYYGNVTLGRDIDLDTLRDIYDAVVLAVGMPGDRELGVPGEDKKGVIGSAAFVGWYNGHPDFRDLNPNLDTGNVVVIGNGNVAIDIARVLKKNPRRDGRNRPAAACRRGHPGGADKGGVYGRPARPGRSEVHQCRIARNGAPEGRRADRRFGRSS